jgi:Flp pilus assembly protein TadD
MNQGDLAVEHAQMDRALEHYSAAAKMVPGNPEMLFWQGVALAGHGQPDAARPLLRQAFDADPAFLELTRRLPAAGLLDAATAERIVREAGP